MQVDIKIPNLGWLVERASLSKRGASKDNGDEWSGGSFAEAVQRARYGWPEGARQAARMLKAIHARLPMQAVQNATVASVSGAYVDVGAFTEGVPESMVDFLPDRRRVTHAQLNVSGGYNSGIDAQVAVMRAIGIGAIVDLLESKGIRCTVTVWTLNQVNNNTLDIKHEVKSASQPLNLDALTFALGSPLYFRRLIFGLMESLEPKVRDAFNVRPMGGYGTMQDIPKVPGAIRFQTLSDKSDWSLETVAKRAVQILNELNG